MRLEPPRISQKHALIFHGYHATPSDHWFGWLAQRLEATGVPTAIPVLPNPNGPDPKRWEEATRAVLGVPGERTVLVAHSLGCLTVLRYLGSILEPWRMDTLVLVSGFTDPLPTLPELDAFIGDGCDVASLRQHMNRIVVVRSDDDPVVPTAHTDRLASRLGVHAYVVPGAGHFLTSDGVTSLPEVIDALAP